MGDERKVGTMPMTNATCPECGCRHRPEGMHVGSHVLPGCDNAWHGSRDYFSDTIAPTESAAEAQRRKAAGCDQLVNLAGPARRERVRGFQPPWYTVLIYRCANGHETRVRANGGVPGAIRCSHAS